MKVAAADPQAIMAFAKAAELGSKWKCELLQKGQALNTAVVRPFQSGIAHSISFLPDGKVFKPVVNSHRGPFWTQILLPEAFAGRRFTEFRQISKTVFEIDDLHGPYSRWTKGAGQLGTAQDRQSFVTDLKANPRWKVQGTSTPRVQTVRGAWESEEGGVAIDFGGDSFSYDYQAIVKKGSAYQIWWDMTGPTETWTPITGK